MKQGFPHCDTPESVELVHAQSPTLLLEVLGNHQVFLLGQGRAATFISQYKSFLLVIVSEKMKMAQTTVLALCLQSQMGQNSPASSITILDERSIVVCDII